MIAACLLTVIIEYLYMTKRAGYDTKDEKRLVIFTNVFTNIVMNVALAAVVFGLIRDLSVGGATALPLLVLFGAIVVLEAIVVAVEYLIYRLAFGKLSGLFKHTLTANLLSFGIGLAVAGLITLIFVLL